MNSRPIWLRDEVEQWNADTLDRLELRKATSELRQRPGFDRACVGFANNMLSAFASNKPLNKLMKGDGQLAFFGFVLMLHHTRNPADPTTGVTYSRISELFLHLKIASPTMVKGILALAKMRGQLRYVASPNKRLRVLEPTEKLRGPMNDWFKANLTGVAYIEPLPAPAADLAAMPGLLEEVMTYCVYAYVHNGFILPEQFPSVRTFLSHDHGYVILMEIIRSLRHEPDGHILANASTGDLAQHLSISRGTVRNMLNKAYKEGWITHLGRGTHEIELSHDFAELCADYMAWEFTWMAGLVKVAVAALLAKSTD